MTALLALYIVYAAGNLYANMEMHGYDRSFLELLIVFASGFFCTPYAAYLAIKILIKPGYMQEEMSDPNFERTSWVFSIIANSLIIFLWV